MKGEQAANDKSKISIYGGGGSFMGTVNVTPIERIFRMMMILNPLEIDDFETFFHPFSDAAFRLPQQCHRTLSTLST